MEMKSPKMNTLSHCEPRCRLKSYFLLTVRVMRRHSRLKFKRVEK